ncbi:MAG: hypothetical protein IJ427_07150 [Lachnospiraceae bacterium]|nr:hypothetical protein [Lachnospiraceae bacterium]
MSGIFGVLQYGETVAAADRMRLQKWNAAYGVQTETVTFGDLFFGCTQSRYSDKMPECSPVGRNGSKYAVIDALLFNRDEIKEKSGLSEELSDEELLFLYIEKFGYEALREVNGDFAGVVYDEEKGSMTLFRDHMGVRPLFYYNRDGVFVFSTDIRGLVSMDTVDTSTDEEWLWSALTGAAYMGTEYTEFANIRCVKPASYYTVTRKDDTFSLVVKTYWKPGEKKIRLSSEAAYIERHKELITDAVKRRLDAVSGPVAAELSGGLDSSIIDILIHRLGREAHYFSWSLSPEELPYAENDERLIVEDICKQEGIVCHFSDEGMELREGSVIYRKMKAIGMEPELNAGLYRRYVFPPYISTTQIGKVAQSAHDYGAKVVFTGHGGDEGVSHRCNPYELFYYKEYLHYFSYMWESTKGLKHRCYHTVIRSLHNLVKTRKRLRSPFVSVFASKAMLNREIISKYEGQKGLPNMFAYDPLRYVRNGGSRNRLDIVALLGEYCGARYFAPYLDYRVIDYALSIPRHMYLKKQKKRYIIREAFRDMIPESLYNLTGKEDTSWRNVEKPEIDIEEHVKHKNRLIAMLDREYWNRYLNWEELTQWANIAAEEERDSAMFMGIDKCLSLQNLITFSRKVGEAEGV